MEARLTSESFDTLEILVLASMFIYLYVVQFTLRDQVETKL